MKSVTWLLLLYSLPMKRTSARVNLWRKLKRFGAVQLKTSAYVLPDDAIHYERFQWLAKETRDAGGEATLIRVADIEGMGADQVVELFNEARGEEYRELTNRCRKTLKLLKLDGEGLRSELVALQRRFAEINVVDYFKSPAASEAEIVLKQVERLVAPNQSRTPAPRLEPARFRGRTWVTRPRPGIDRAGSAWLIRKYIDRKARFVFADEPTEFPKALPFDMADVEFSHHGDDCTFETFTKRFGIGNAAVQKMAEMVHDADLEDGKFQRPECIGINAVLGGWARTKISDAELLAKGIECFEGLYQGLIRHAPIQQKPKPVC
jgi:hypothetical protein